MGWLCRLLNATPKSELNGIRMDIVSPFWELQGETTFAVLLRALGDFLPAGSVLYFEGGSPDRKLLDFLNAHAIPEQTHVAVAILWPRPVYYHIPATPQNLAELAALAESHAEPELAVHFHAYQEEKVFLEWHDAFAQPMLIDGSIPEEHLKPFAEVLDMKFKLNTETVEQNDGQLSSESALSDEVSS